MQFRIELIQDFVNSDLPGLKNLIQQQNCTFSHKLGVPLTPWFPVHMEGLLQVTECTFTVVQYLQFGTVRQWPLVRAHYSALYWHSAKTPGSEHCVSIAMHLCTVLMKASTHAEHWKQSARCCMAWFLK